jgi:hypothetical protein
MFSRVEIGAPHHSSFQKLIFLPSPRSQKEFAMIVGNSFFALDQMEG